VRVMGEACNLIVHFVQTGPQGVKGYLF
jgi:hypothetical protein